MVSPASLYSMCGILVVLSCDDCSWYGFKNRLTLSQQSPVGGRLPSMPPIRPLRRSSSFFPQCQPLTAEITASPLWSKRGASPFASDCLCKRGMGSLHLPESCLCQVLLLKRIHLCNLPYFLLKTAANMQYSRIFVLLDILSTCWPGTV